MKAILRSIASSLCHQYPFFSGCGTLANSKIFRWLTMDLRALQAVRLRNGAKIIIPPSDYVGRSIYFFGDLDRKVSWIYQRLLRPGDTLIDIGANLGLTTLIGSLLVGPNGCVHAFEPQPYLTNLLDQSIQLNSISNITVHNIGLGSRSEDLELFVPSDNAGAASLVPKRTTAGKYVRVRIENCSEYFKRLRLLKIRLVKIDAEGYESEILRGAKEFFKLNPPDAVLFELNKRGTPFLQKQSVINLMDIGYKFFDIEKRMLFMQLNPIDTDAPKVEGHDILAVREGQIYEEVTRLVHSTSFLNTS